VLQGIVLVDKPKNMTSFGVVAALRRRSGVKKIGHGGTLDPFATGLLVLFISRQFTKQAGLFLQGDKEYIATLMLGMATDTHDSEGKSTATSQKIPTEQEVLQVLSEFQGKILQVPPMFSAKKKAGKRLYELARKGLTCEREPVEVFVETQLKRYAYPEMELAVRCSKGTYIRALADDIGKKLGSFAYLSELRRTKCGQFSIDMATPLCDLLDENHNVEEFIVNE
jgi:tRNA pseudouridine55 synthase